MIIKKGIYNGWKLEECVRDILRVGVQNMVNTYKKPFKKLPNWFKRQFINSKPIK